MTKFNPLNFIADHARMNLADAIKEAYEQGKRDAQPEPSIPISWIDEQIEWLKGLDNGFSTITAMQISTMVNKWNREGEQDAD